MRGYHVYKVLWKRRVGESVKYLGFPMPELSPFVQRDAEIRDTEYLRRYTVYEEIYIPYIMIFSRTLYFDEFSE